MAWSDEMDMVWTSWMEKNEPWERELDVKLLVDIVNSWHVEKETILFVEFP